jgi:hypothetical protein
MKAPSISQTRKPNVALSDDSTFMELYCACLNGVASQLEQTFSPDEGLRPQDIYCDHQRNREQEAVKRAYRMACLAFEELQINNAFAK